MNTQVRAADAFRALVGPGHVHSDKWHQCWVDVQKKGHDESSAAAICTKSLGEDSFDRAAEQALLDVKTEERELHLRAAVGKMRTELYDGREHLVVPVVACMEGVIHAVNASEPEFVPSHALAASVSGWNGRPVVLGHPTKDGRQISANDPKVLESHRFGSIFNARMDGSRLCMEAWIDPKKLETLDSALLERIKKSEQIEVSIGAHVRTELKAGEHRGKKFRTAWRELSSDHLAFLPKSRGACSVEMGCGALRAAEGSAEYPVYEVLDGGLLALSGDESLDVRMRRITDAVRLKFSGKAASGVVSNGAWPREVYDDHVIVDIDGKLFSVDYEDDGINVSFTSEPVEVRQKPTEYVPVTKADPRGLEAIFEELKTLVGKRHSASDQKMLQTMHDHAVALGAECGEQRGAETHYVLPDIFRGADIDSPWFRRMTAALPAGSETKKAKKDCPHCDGMGQMGKKDCPYCEGSGKVRAASSWFGNVKDVVVGLFRPEPGPVKWIERPEDLRTFGDAPGHPFHGNQHTDGHGATNKMNDHLNESFGKSFGQGDKGLRDEIAKRLKGIDQTDLTHAERQILRDVKNGAPLSSIKQRLTGIAHEDMSHAERQIAALIGMKSKDQGYQPQASKDFKLSKEQLAHNYEIMHGKKPRNAEEWFVPGVKDLTITTAEAAEDETALAVKED